MAAFSFLFFSFPTSITSLSFSRAPSCLCSAGAFWAFWALTTSFRNTLVVYLETGTFCLSPIPLPGIWPSILHHAHHHTEKKKKQNNCLRQKFSLSLSLYECVCTRVCVCKGFLIFFVYNISETKLVVYSAHNMLWGIWSGLFFCRSYAKFRHQLHQNSIKNPADRCSRQSGNIIHHRTVWGVIFLKGNCLFLPRHRSDIAAATLQDSTPRLICIWADGYKLYGFSL